MAQSSDCWLCPGTGTLWVVDGAATYDGFCELEASSINWVELPHIKSATLTPDIEDPPEVRTSQTGGNKVKACEGAVTWTCEVSAVLCALDWLWCYLFPAVVYDCPDGGSATVNVLNYSTPATRFFAFNPDTTKLDSQSPTADESLWVYFQGRANIGNFGFDNDDTEPTETDFTIDILDGPWQPKCKGQTVNTTIQNGDINIFPEGTGIASP